MRAKHTVGRELKIAPPDIVVEGRGGIGQRRLIDGLRGVIHAGNGGGGTEVILKGAHDGAAQG